MEVKDAGPAMDKPIKSEGIAQSPNSSERSSGATSPPPDCSICLGKLINTSFTDSCLHQFCFTCLLQWSKIKTECPLCKQTFKSIIHNVRSEEDYDQYHVPRQLIDNGHNIFELDGTWDLNDSSFRRFFYRTTMTPYRRRQMFWNPWQVARREQIPSVPAQVPREEQRFRRSNPMDYRRRVYRLGAWAVALPGVFGRFRECSAEYYRRQPRELSRLVPWINRELQALLSNAPQAAYVMRVIIDALTQFDIRSPQFRDLVRPYFGVYAEQFLHELFNFAGTNYDLVGYDQSVVYLPQGLSNEYVPRVVSPSTSSSGATSDDSDVRVLEEALDEAIDLRVNTEMPSVGPHAMNMPGPSTVGQAFQLEMPYNAPDVLTISSNSSSSDECQVVDYVKPRHARTPEIIVLLSSDPEDGATAGPANESTEVPRSSYGEVPQPGTSDVSKRWKQKRTKMKDMSMSDSESDKDAVSTWLRLWNSLKKNSTFTRRRKRSTGGRGRNRSARSQSTSDDSDSRKRSGKKSSGRSRKRRSSSSDSSYDPGRSIDDGRTRRRSYSTRSSTRRVHTDVARRSNRYVNDSSSSDSSSESDNDMRKSYRSRAQRKSKRKYSTSSSSDTTTVKCDRLTRGKEKSRQTSDGSLKDVVKKKFRDRRSRSRSSSPVSYDSDASHKSSRKKCETPTANAAGYSTEENSVPVNTDLSRCSNSNHTEVRVRTTSTSNSEDECNARSSSHSSGQSRRQYAHRKRSSHKERGKSKSRKRSSSRSRNSFQSTSHERPSSSTEAESGSRHSDSKNPQSNTSKSSCSSSSSRHKSRRSHKDSKHRRSQSDSKSKSKKKRRRVRSSSNSNPELCRVDYC